MTDFVAATDFVATLASSSKGNSIYINACGTACLIDAGISARAIRAALPTDISGVRAVFVTHEHTDHVRGLAVLTKTLSAPVHAPARCAPRIACETVPHEGGFRETVGGLEFEAFETPHDSAASVGYIVRGEGFSLGVATDLGYMPAYALGLLCSCENVILEANHDIDLLMRGPYPPYLKERILSDCGHLSNDDASRAAVTLAENGVKRILLAHLSEENNRPELAAIAVSAALARKNLKTEITVASACRPTALLSRERSSGYIVPGARREGETAVC